MGFGWTQTTRAGAEEDIGMEEGKVVALLFHSSSAPSTLGSPALPSMLRILKMCCLVKRTLCSARARLISCLKIKNFLPHSFHQDYFRRKKLLALQKLSRYLVAPQSQIKKVKGQSHAHTNSRACTAWQHSQQGEV